MSKITPTLWFDGQAEEAAAFYTGLFPNSSIDGTQRAAAENPSTPAGAVLTVDFTLDGTPFIGINGGPDFPFTEAVSFTIDCQDQAEVDRYWDALVEGGGEHSVCGWLKDRFGVSWQVEPTRLLELMQDPDTAKVARVNQAMMQMKKIVIADIEAAARG
jgi:predicted 3-demethylubiquinone-9 3-methyltransferase (glyoxalase superfamily)